MSLLHEALPYAVAIVSGSALSFAFRGLWISTTLEGYKKLAEAQQKVIEDLTTRIGKLEDGMRVAQFDHIIVEEELKGTQAELEKMRLILHIIIPILQYIPEAQQAQISALIKEVEDLHNKNYERILDIRANHMSLDRLMLEMAESGK